MEKEEFEVEEISSTNALYRLKKAVSSQMARIPRLRQYLGIRKGLYTPRELLEEYQRLKRVTQKAIYKPLQTSFKVPIFGCQPSSPRLLKHLSSLHPCLYSHACATPPRSRNRSMLNTASNPWSLPYLRLLNLLRLRHRLPTTPRTTSNCRRTQFLGSTPTTPRPHMEADTQAGFLDYPPRQGASALRTVNPDHPRKVEASGYE